jgi:hypothetical protein
MERGGITSLRYRMVESRVNRMGDDCRLVCEIHYSVVKLDHQTISVKNGAIIELL